MAADCFVSVPVNVALTDTETSVDDDDDATAPDEIMSVCDFRSNRSDRSGFTIPSAKKEEKPYIMIEKLNKKSTVTIRSNIFVTQ